MTKREKRLEKLRQSQKNVSMQELSQVLGDFGFEIEHSPNGSHYKFEYNKVGLVIRLIIPFRRPIKPYYVKDAIKAIDQVKEY
ncbi:MAG: type II toxin-antitoxin system HicA family toxin [Anaerolineae bacterium]|nr:type II toxin-antitoxin system HicA family toxin [Anaerolineae bacterium]